MQASGKRTADGGDGLGRQVGLGGMGGHGIVVSFGVSEAALSTMATRNEFR